MHVTFLAQISQHFLVIIILLYIITGINPFVGKVQHT